MKLARRTAQSECDEGDEGLRQDRRTSSARGGNYSGESGIALHRMTIIEETSSRGFHHLEMWNGNGRPTGPPEQMGEVRRRQESDATRDFVRNLELYSLLCCVSIKML